MSSKSSAFPGLIGRRQVLAGLLATPIAGCASLSGVELQALGNRVDQASLDFRPLHLAARRADDAARDEATIRRNWPDTRHVATVRSVDVTYVLERNDSARTQYVSMPGSRSLTDWLEDFDIFLKPEARYGIPLHRGFEDAALAVYEDLKPRLDKAHRTHLIGYSMGAGVAAVLSLYMAEDGYNLVRTTTFGQPRVTNASGVAALSRLPITRVVNADDFVSMVPTFPFEHFGEEVILHDGPDYVYLTHQDANRLSIGEIWRQHHGLDIAAHSSATYVARLAAKVAGARPVPYLTRLA
ncbi:Lipase (class 3) [Devosia enhydra]|uniref:Lipase (Class 3) n=1 Tax=Devosia enhydra TaxID=665118 RepID=A0A1K2HY28_9HYPH|nr:lipase family protein [Devosia enhydra]SFZ84659.1 Lipase (class 3) [Devosia enhydra]